MTPEETVAAMLPDDGAGTADVPAFELPPELAIDTDVARRIIAEFIRAQLRQAGVAKAVLGLSGGIDSGVLAAVMAEAGRGRIEGVTIAYDEFVGSREDEAPVAATIAARYGIRHHVRRVTRDEFTADLPENRILKFTLWRLARAGPGDDALRRRLRRTLSAFGEVSLAAVTPADCERVVYTRLNESYRCLLYTSDAADERSSVDLGGRRILKKKKEEKKLKNSAH